MTQTRHYIVLTIMKTADSGLSGNVVHQSIDSWATTAIDAIKKVCGDNPMLVHAVAYTNVDGNWKFAGSIGAGSYVFPGRR